MICRMLILGLVMSVGSVVGCKGGDSDGDDKKEVKKLVYECLVGDWVMDADKMIVSDLCMKDVFVDQFLKIKEMMGKMIFIFIKDIFLMGG